MIIAIDDIGLVYYLRKSIEN